jgi:hypothetical protein
MKIYISASTSKQECRLHTNKPSCQPAQGWCSAGYETLNRRFLAEMICSCEQALPDHKSFDLMVVEFGEVNITNKMEVKC